MKNPRDANNPLDYKKLYLKAFGYSEFDYIPSELSGLPAVDFCHIKHRGAGKKTGRMNFVENLVALTREEHLILDSSKKNKRAMLETHINFMIKNGVPVNRARVEELLNSFTT